MRERVREKKGKERVTKRDKRKRKKQRQTEWCTISKIYRRRTPVKNLVSF